MCIYKNKKTRKEYRKIYEQYFGPIPKDSDGRSYEIHHRDGDYTNNTPNNLQCVTIQEHFNIHYNQEDWGACRAIAMRMEVTPEEKSKLSSLSNIQRVQDGTHNFLGKDNPGANRQRELVKEGAHHFLGKNNPGITACRGRVSNGTHHLLQRGDKHPQYDNTIHTLCHKDGRIFVGTQNMFRQQYPDINQGNLSSLISGKRTNQGRYVRSVKGWSLP